MLSNFKIGKVTIVSSPGKVMLLGGYLVLNKSPALTLALNAKFKIRIENNNCLMIESLNYNKKWNDISLNNVNYYF
jgi:mevalonate kinase